MKIFKKIIAIIVVVILTLILSFNIFNFISINILGNDLPTINGYAYLEVISGSMEPKIRIGDIVIIDTKVNSYKVKDIVTFRDTNGSFVTHRIIEIKDNEIITQGDANNTIDDAITKDQIVGRYVYQINGLGALMKSFRSPLTLVMILIIGVITCVLVSTDSKGNAILTDEEKEYLEFLESKKNKKEIKEEKITKTKKQPTKKVTVKEIKPEVKKETTKKKTETKPKKKVEEKKVTTKKPTTKATKTTSKKETTKKTIETKSKKKIEDKLTKKTTATKAVKTETSKKKTQTNKKTTSKKTKK